MHDRNNTEGYLKLPAIEDNHCFGCGERNEHGLHMEFYTDKSRVFSWLTVPDYMCGWDSIVHGGIVSTVLDEIMSWTTIYFTSRFIFTKNASIDYLKPVRAGDELVAEGRVLETVSPRRAVTEGKIYDSAGNECAISRGTFALFTLEDLKKRGMVTPKVLTIFDTFFRATGEN